jgi:electron transfer flavoprotein alpha subunit
MSVLAYIENPNGQIKKSGFEVATYAAQIAAKLGVTSTGVVIGAAENIQSLASYGLNKIVHINPSVKIPFDSQVYTRILAEQAGNSSASVVVLTHSCNGKSLCGRLAVRLGASSVSGANALPETEGGFTVTKNVYSGKALVRYHLPGDRKVISLMGNSIQPEISSSTATIETLEISLPVSRLRVIETKTAEGRVPLPEAEVVVSAGRGLKGPENWGIVEELAEALGATTACSRPVADSGWRPHHEHVGQTGVAIRPNLYIAAGISGAIQHLAGVNSSKTIVVINKDAEAPFFKAADYGVVGDVFEVLPRLTEAVRKFRQS